MNDDSTIRDDQLDSGLRSAFASDPDGPNTLLDQVHIGDRRAPRIRLLNLGNSEAPPLEVRSSEIDIRAGYIGRLKLQREVARGGVGVILEAWDPDLGRKVAVKVLGEQHAGNYGLLQRFIEEAQIGAQLQHPGIVPVYELGLDGEHRPYFSMKLVEGTTLALLLKQRQDPSAGQHRLLTIFEQVCQTIAYAHARGVVHRDLKPGNIMVGAFGEVQVMDWGFAKVLGNDEAPLSDRPTTVRTDSDNQSIVGSVFGTPNYMSPEQARGEPVDARADVFGLGAILFEILVGRPPYVGDDAAQQAKVGATQRIAAELDATDSPILRDLAKACLNPDKDDRPASAATVAEGIAEHAASISKRAHTAEIQAAAAEARAKAERRVRRRTQLLSAVLLVSAFALAWVFWNASVESRVLQQRVAACLDDAKAHLDAGEPNAAQASVMQAEGLAQTTGSLDRRLSKDIANLKTSVGHHLRDVELRRALIRLRSRLGRDRNVSKVYQATFDDYGVDLTKTPQEIESSLRAKACTILPEVARGLEDLAQRKIRAGSTADHLLQVADRIDPDELRRSIREALRETDAERLLRLVPEVGGETPVETAHLLANSLAACRSIREAIQLLERIVQEHEDDLWLHFELARHYRHHGSSTEAAKHLRLAKELHPEKDWDPFSPNSGRGPGSRRPPGRRPGRRRGRRPR